MTTTLTSNLLNQDGTPNLDAISVTIQERKDDTKRRAELRKLTNFVKTLNEYWTNEQSFRANHILSHLSEYELVSNSVSGQVTEMLKHFNGIEWDSMRVGRREDFAKLLITLMVDPQIEYNEERDWFQLIGAQFVYATDRPPGVYEEYALSTADATNVVKKSLIRAIFARIRKIFTKN